MYRKRRAFILGTIMVLMPILIILMVALIASLRSGKGNAQMYHARASSLCVAEAGLVDALAELETDPNWIAGFNQKSMRDVDGTYTVTFNQSGAGFTSDDSVNNQDGTHPDSYRGTNTVPPGATLLVVTSQVAGVERRLEALVAPASSSINLDTSLLTSGRIRMQGNVEIDGIASLDDSTSVSADLQSNNTADASSDVITWSDPGGTALNIDGKISASGSSTGTVNVGGGTVTGGISEQATAVPIPTVNIPAEIASKSSSPAPTIVSGGTTVVSSGDYYVSGDLTLNGDLQLNDGNLYVAGKLTVNGSVSGSGSVYVGSDTQLHGNADISGKNNLALFSKGNVQLLGFDGTAYLDSLASGNSSIATWMADAEWALQEMENGTVSGFSGADLSYLDSVSTVLGGPQNVLLPPSGRSQSAVWKIRDHLSSSVSPGATRDFLIARLDKVGRIYSQNGLVLGQPDSAAISAYESNGNTDGLWDAVNDLNYGPLKQAVYNTTKDIDYDYIGRSSFQGLVYTNGSFYAGNEVSIRGAIVVNNDGSQSSTTIDGNTIDPGDLFINEGCEVTFVEDFFDGDGVAAGSGKPRVVLWMGR